MEYRSFDRTILVRLDKGDNIVESLLSVAASEGVTLASVSGIGAVDTMTVGVWDLSLGDYERYTYLGNREINALVGNLTTKDGAPYLHLHITATGAGGMVVGGHLMEATVSLTAEIFLHLADGAVERRFDPVLGINRISFNC